MGFACPADGQTLETPVLAASGGRPQPPEEPMTAAQVFYRVPLIGWMTREAVQGPDDAKYYFAGNLFLIVAFAIWQVGYPLLIILALAGAAFGLVTIVIFTAADMFENKDRKRKPARPTAREALRR